MLWRLTWPKWTRRVERAECLRPDLWWAIYFWTPCNNQALAYLYSRCHDGSVLNSDVLPCRKGRAIHVSKRATGYAGKMKLQQFNVHNTIIYMGCLDERFNSALGNPDIVYSVRVFSTEIYWESTRPFTLELHALEHSTNTNNSIVCMSKGVGRFVRVRSTGRLTKYDSRVRWITFERSPRRTAMQGRCVFNISTALPNYPLQTVTSIMSLAYVTLRNDLVQTPGRYVGQKHWVISWYGC